MNKHEQEIESRFGANLLKKMQADYKHGFHIVGETGKSVVIGDGFVNSEYSRKSGRVLGTFTHSKTRKMMRKA